MFLSYSTWGMKHTPIETAVSHCASLGFDGLELTVIPGWPTDAATLTGEDRRRIRRLYDDHRLELCGFSGNVPLLSPAGDDDVMARFRSYLDLAAELQHPGERLIVSTTSGGLPADWEAAKHQLAEMLGEFATYAARSDVMVGIEPHVGAALHLPEHVLWIIEQVDSPALTLHFDISHFNVQGMDMEKAVAQLAPLCLHTHVKDERGIAPDHEFLIPGEGDMDYVRYLRAMQRAGYDGHIVVEISLMVQARPDYDALEAASRSYAVLSQAFGMAGVERQPRS
jgi:sugar phosphate isomerase/epimerase